jgi:DNA-binding MarR family transcriptional regulator
MEREGVGGVPRWRRLEMEEADVPSPEQRAASLLGAFAFAVRDGIEEVLSSGDPPLSLPAAAILHTIHHLPRIQPVELGLAVGVTHTPCVRIVNQLVQRGLVTRSRDPTDARASILELTREGERQSRAATLRQNQFTETLVKRIPPYWLPRLIRVLERLLPVLTPDARRGLAACRHCDWGACRLNDATPCPVVAAALMRRATAEAEAARERAIPWWHGALPPEERPPLPPLEIRRPSAGSPQRATRLMLALALDEIAPEPRQGRRRRWPR